MLYFNRNTRGNHTPEQLGETVAMELETAAQKELVDGWRRFCSGLTDRDREALKEVISSLKA